jgi:hypothetical protein
VQQLLIQDAMSELAQLLFVWLGQAGESGGAFGTDVPGEPAALLSNALPPRIGTHTQRDPALLCNTSTAVWDPTGKSGCDGE